MCAIVDANVGHEVFGDTQILPKRESIFLDWLNRREWWETLAIGGKLREELCSNQKLPALGYVSVATASWTNYKRQRRPKVERREPKRSETRNTSL